VRACGICDSSVSMNLAFLGAYGERRCAAGRHGRRAVAPSAGADAAG
jgi:hypothetical protein